MGGITVTPQRGLSGLRQADTIIIPGWRNPDEAPPQELIRALLKAHERGVRLVSICSGLFVLSATGLMNGRRATTHWRQTRLHEQITVEQLAKEAHVSKRTLSRRFAETTGTSPLDWIAGLRVRRAKDLLETTTLSVEEIGEQCGFRSAAVLRHHFRTRVKLSPNMYRNQFRQIASATH